MSKLKDRIVFTDDWHFDKPKKTGRYLCILDYGNKYYDHEILDFFKDGKDAGVEYADKHNFWARLYDETWEWIEVKNVAAWQHLTFPAEFNSYHISLDKVDE